MSLKQNNQIGSNLIGGATAVLLAIPVAAFFGSIFGDTYQARSTVYILILAWVVAGAFAIGLSLYKTAINYMAGNSANTYEVIVEQRGQTAALVYGSWQNWLVAFFTLAVVTVLNHFGKGIWKLSSILIGMLAGYIVSIPCLLYTSDAADE